MIKSVTKILIIRYSSMGDVILIAPLISVLRKQYPAATIVLLTQQSYTKIFAGDSRVSKLIGVKNGHIAPELQKYGAWDIIIDLQNNKKSKKQINVLSFKKLHSFKKQHFKRIILLIFKLNLYKKRWLIAENYIKTSGEKITADRFDYTITISNKAGKRFLPLLQHGKIKRPVIALFPFSAWKNKEWPEDYFISVGQFFLIKGWNVVLLGGKADRERAFEMEQKIGFRCISLAGRMDLQDCSAVLKKCNLSLGCDSGLSHLARASGIKCGIIFGPTTKHFGFQPYDDKMCCIFEVNRWCRPCHPHGGNVCFRLDHGCMRQITPEMVVKGLLTLYHG